MKKWLVSIIVASVIASLLLIPSGFLAADSNLIKNGDFYAEEPGHWWAKLSGDAYWNQSFGNPEPSIMLGPASGSTIFQERPATNKNLILSCDVYNYWEDPAYSHIPVNLHLSFIIYSEGNELGGAGKHFSNLPDAEWKNFSLSISDSWEGQFGTEIPDFDRIRVFIAANGYLKMYVDNVSLAPPAKTSAETEEPAPWVRDKEMTCYQVWINDAGNFEFVFWWEYKNNNWVKIYDMQGNEVFSIDMKYGNAKFEADLPDGMYTVKTFHSSDMPIQEFIIGKP